MRPVYIMNQRCWPGLENWHGPREPKAHGHAFGERAALVLHVATINGSGGPDAALGSYLLVMGPSIIEGGVIVPNGLSAVDRRRVDQWAARHSVCTLSGSKPWVVCTVSEFTDPKKGVFVTTAYTGRGWCIGVDLGRVFGALAERWTPRSEPNADMWELWLSGWGKVHNGSTVKRVSPHRPALRLRARRVGWQVEFGPLEQGNGIWEGTAPRKGEFLDLLSAAYALDGDRGANYGEHRMHFGLPFMELPLSTQAYAGDLTRMTEAVHGIHALSQFIAKEAKRWFPS